MVQTGSVEVKTQDQSVVGTSGTRANMGIQFSMVKGKVEHHRTVETVRTFKENRADVTRKEIYESRWIE